MPFERTATYRRFDLRVDPEPLSEQDLYTKSIVEEQGFDGLPHVLPETEIDRCVQAGETELFRGVSALAHADQLRLGEMFVGRGTFGGGIYAAGGSEGRRHATDYAQDPDGVIVRMTLKGGARIANARHLLQQMWEVRSGVGTRPRAAARVARWALTERASVYATYLGYDGLVDPATDVWLILNRTALRIQREDYKS